MRPFLLNRFVAAAVLLAVIVAGWNLYVAENDDGIIAGRVIGVDSAPIAGAKVTVDANEINNVSSIPVTVLTNSQGEFLFKGIRFFQFLQEI